jgi:hypothetical protein
MYKDFKSKTMLTITYLTRNEIPITFFGNSTENCLTIQTVRCKKTVEIKIPTLTIVNDWDQSSLVLRLWESVLKSNGLVFKHHLKSKTKKSEFWMVGPFENQTPKSLVFNCFCHSDDRNSEVYCTWLIIINDL